MKPVLLFLCLVLPVGPLSLIAEVPTANSNSRSGAASSEDGSAVVMSQRGHQGTILRPFTLGATMESVSSLGAQFQFATNLNRHMNLRSGLDLLIWKTWITYGGFTAPANVSLISSNTSIDFYPFAHRGLRISPGILIHNPVAATSLVGLAPSDGGPFTLNGHTYYSKYTPSSNPDPRMPAPGPEPAMASEALQMRKSAFTITTGWGNMISRRTGHFSFPVEAGVAFLGSPTIKPLWTGGQICDAQLENCQEAATNPQFQADLEAEFGGYKSHLNLLKTYPIISFGLAYSWSSHQRTATDQ